MLNVDEIKKIAHLAKLELSEEELEVFAREFNSIREFIGQIIQCDTEGVEAEHHLEDHTDQVLRDDYVKLGLTQYEALMNATERTEGGYVKTSQIIYGNDEE